MISESLTATYVRTYFAMYSYSVHYKLIKVITYLFTFKQHDINEKLADSTELLSA